MTTAPVARAAGLVVAALDALEAAGVAYCLRNGTAAHHPEPGADVDVLVSPTDRRRTRAALAGAGWSRLRAPGHPGHEFWVRQHPETGWLKLDVVDVLRYGRLTEPVAPVIARRTRVDGVWCASPEDEEAHRAHRAAGRREVVSRWQRVRRAGPASLRRRGAVVAVLGPDGAGKGTVVDAVRAALPVAVSTVYLGDRRTSGSAHAGRPAAAPRPLPSPLRETAFLVRKWLRLQPQVAWAYARAWRGHVVICDRHPLDALAVAPRRTPVGQRVEALLARRLTPSPDAVVVLDAPGQVLWERKHEHTPAVLERWRRGYAALPGADVVSTTEGVDVTVSRVLDVVWRALADRRGW